MSHRLRKKWERMQIGRSEPDLESIVNRINRGELDLQPDFQRGEVWDMRRKQRLIDTILRRWYVPAVHVLETASGEESVLDGQQRLRTIQEFFSGKFRVDGKIEPSDESIKALHGLTFAKLPPTSQRAIQRFQLTVVKLTSFLPQEPNELFFRLNQSYNLTPPEKRNALHGAARDQVKELVKQLTSAGLLQPEKVGFSNGRLAYDDIIARCCVALERGDLSAHINNTVVEEYYRDSNFSDSTILAVRDGGLALLDQLNSSNEKVRFNKATLFTWIIFAHSFPILSENPLPSALLDSFEKVRKAKKQVLEPSDRPSPAIANIVDIYDDRASYRVTDVSSVLARDLALHLFCQAAFDISGTAGSKKLLLALNDTDIRANQIFFQFIDEAKWAADITRSRGGDLA